MCLLNCRYKKFPLQRNYPKKRMLVALLQYKQKMSLSDTKRVELIKDWSETVQIMPSWNNNEYFLVSFFIQRETTEDNLWNYSVWKKTQILTYVAPFLIGMLKEMLPDSCKCPHISHSSYHVKFLTLKKMQGESSNQNERRIWRIESLWITKAKHNIE